MESALERGLSRMLMAADQRPEIRKVKQGQLVVEQGQAGSDVFLLLDGVLSVEVDGQTLGEVGPGAILGERAILEGGIRTSTLRAITKCKLAVASGSQIDRDLLAQLAEGHRREETL